MQGDRGKIVWYLDSGCARHMTGSKHLLERFYVQKGPGVKFGGDSTASVMCIFQALNLYN